MNIKEMAKILSMASSGEMQAFIARIQTEWDELNKDRLALRRAFPAAYVHFNARMDTMEEKLDSVLALLADAPWQAKQGNPTKEQNHVGQHHNGTEYPLPDPAAAD